MCCGKHLYICLFRVVFSLVLQNQNQTNHIAIRLLSQSQTIEGIRDESGIVSTMKVPVVVAVDCFQHLGKNCSNKQTVFSRLNARYQINARSPR